MGETLKHDQHFAVNSRAVALMMALLARDQPFPFDYMRAWEDVAEHVLDGLRLQAE